MNRYESFPKKSVADARPRKHHLVRRALLICIGTVVLAGAASAALYFTQAGVTAKSELPAWGVIVSLGNSAQIKANTPSAAADAQAKTEPSAVPAATPISLVQAANLVDKADADVAPARDKDSLPDRLPTLSVAAAVDTKADQSAVFALSINADGALPDNCEIIIHGLPAGTTLSAGRSDEAGAWLLAPDDLDGLTITPKGAVSGSHDLTIELKGPDGRVANTVHTALRITGAVAADDQAAPPRPVATADEIRNWMSHGRTLQRVGYFAGARLFFRRVAEAGWAEGAQAMGETYDPAEFQKLGVHGLTPDAALAQKWYDRAKALEKAGGAQAAAQSQ
ncbi:MAG: hypothetical protein AB1508_15085 [Pseudomonadota bacterium]